jgi:hypothetical protein
MRAAVQLTILVLTLILPARSLEAQIQEELILSEFETIAESVIRIRTVANLGLDGTQPATERPYTVDGTGVVVGALQVDGRTEYLILTNHHVADASVYVLQEGGYLRMNPNNTMAIPSVPEESYLMMAATDSVSDADVALIEMVRRVSGDMTLMRTVGANRELTVFEGVIGYEEGLVQPGDQIVIGGYPWGREKLIAVGEIVEVDFPHALGVPHEDFVLSTRVVPGQSGGPIFRIEEGGEGLLFRLIGLVHARDADRNYGVTYRSWGESLDRFPEVLQERMVR